jgi:hypothetical protein
MPRPRGQFTIAHLMLAIAAAAVLLALPPVPRGIAIVLVIPWLSATAARRLVSLRHRRLAACSFWAVAASTNLVVAAFCIAPDVNSAGFQGMRLIFWVDLLPTTIALGAAWILLLYRDIAAPVRSREAVRSSVLLMVGLPILTLWTLWPLRVAFLAVRPSLDRLADQVAARKPVGYPRRVGPFRIEAQAVAPVSGYVGLKVAPKGVDTGFVRIHGGATPTTHGPFVGVNFDVYLGGGWWYRG